MPLHARPRPQLICRPSTVLALSLAVTSLTAVAIIQAPGQALADPQAVLSTHTPSAIHTSENPGGRPRSATDLSASPMAALAELRAKRDGLPQRIDERRRQEQREHTATKGASDREPNVVRWVMPVPGAGWSAYFGEAGSAWSSGYHTGQDFTASAGTPVLAAGPGTITSATWSDAYGNIIEITHPNGDQSWYAHMSSFERTEGSVSAGDVIGYVGCTGNCFGTHLHFEYHPGGGAAADPLVWLHRNGAY